MSKRIILIGLLIYLLCHNKNVFAQCSTTINAFPYHEDFEAGQGNWTTGGTNSDWTFGTPNKSIITNAASGSNCWITGTLTGNFYNFGENAWLMSPCFDFTSLTNPQISFNIFWETERRYDGATFQYSINGGTTWQNLGNSNSNNNCLGANWFNYSPITSLGIDGWSGTKLPTSGSCQGSGGSNNWVSAKHILTALAGQSNVRFRFVFGAGTTCNSFNGVAVDDITIAEAPSNTADFIFTCSSNNTVSFTNTSSICGANFIWNFDDLTSSSNSSNAENPTHIFSAPGTYNVSLSVTFPGNIIVTKNKTVTVLNVTTSIVQALYCFGNTNGSVQATVVGGSGTYNYAWNTSPIQTTNVINNLQAGNYTVTVSAANACTTSSTISLAEPTPLIGTIHTQNNLCNQQNGSAEIIVSGGSYPYTYLWGNNATTSIIQNLAANSYLVTVKDDNDCLLNMTAIVKDSTNNIIMSLGNDTSFCPGNQLVLNPGNFAAYLWQNNSTNATYTATTSGNYFVKVTDQDGCTKSDTIKITVDCSDVFFPTAFTPNNDGLNDTFGPIGNIAAITNFSMNVYGRWGQLIFSTNNPFIKWNGKQNGIDTEMGMYVWIATYSINNNPAVTKKGTVLIIR
ncbi:MAG: gliding motility-associated C-terminal domain-containing protein [Chitinophagaceae bacterium]|nr:gliding motility-associated C-terminal domain-containing protein [Chitinophagaceae bacterium]MCW5905532.1 gliding motility-associated C-terminal domain-containing protein [Chitinophagaceae bacterium]